MSVLTISGATGRLGGRIARLLAETGIPQRLLVRDPARAPRLPGADVAVAEFGDRAAVRAALAGSDTVLMISAAESPDRVDRHRAFIDSAAEAGVRQLIYTSFVGAAPDAMFTLGRDHWATEEHIRASGLTFTFLRDNLYADFLPIMVGEDGVIRGPGGDGRAALVAQDDIAEAAVAVLREPAAHANATYDMTGPDAVSFGEVAATMTVVTGRAVSYHVETLEEAYRSRATYGAPDWQVEAWVSTYTSVASGELARVSADIPSLTGHPATSVAEVLRRIEARRTRT
jgi:NAD(P)H dehydrogenase (quinone)